MRVGFALPNIGPLGSKESIRRVAERAEALGYESLWTVARLLYPVKPRTPYAATPDGSLPEVGANRVIFTGTEAQIRNDIEGCREIGASEIFFDPTFQTGAQDLDTWLALMEKLRGWAG